MTSEPTPTRRPITTVRISTVALLGIVAAIAVPAGATALVVSGSVTEKTEQVDINQAGPVEKIVVSDTDSSVHITGSAAVPGVTGHATLQWGELGGDSHPVSLGQSLANGVLTLSKVCDNGECGTADIDIQVPSSVSVQVVTTNGGVQVSNVSGSVNLKTTNGGITADRLGGGDTYLKTTNAPIKAAFVGGPKNITALTTNSPVDITTDGRTSYFDDVQTTNGDPNLEDGSDRHSPNLITVRTTNSPVTVK
ncbi:DUF4097 family beta strand repeat protein [Catenulispora sp. NL8]|uniref:DUF4097 family beta strand repeat protein n=1 Tax=Catenulispora pinistramenti TaxID=2705254 RepID=A0ABS5KYV7_9ACTN|nr:DUF4097 family beta strand repeat-containing protein [Catenulispora pinistramenti]MBS2551261.1 DUF4097 family beta strand repeat protein [Catenulispora pinistramenti]